MLNLKVLNKTFAHHSLFLKFTSSNSTTLLVYMWMISY